MKSNKLTREEFATLDVGDIIRIETELGEIRAEIIGGQKYEGADTVINHLIEYTYVSPLDDEDAIEGEEAKEGEVKQVVPNLAEADDIDIYLEEQATQE